jgi:hypothetical protein
MPVCPDMPHRSNTPGPPFPPIGEPGYSMPGGPAAGVEGEVRPAAE